MFALLRLLLQGSCGGAQRRMALHDGTGAESEERVLGTNSYWVDTTMMMGDLSWIYPGILNPDMTSHGMAHDSYVTEPSHG
mmetsp:Transcript_9208/g.14604  ORF Transcript_9208/g.14604 Transcript_9208/m.14604 type:complete len:81 (-) Transcript_9208:460-702(-)